MSDPVKHLLKTFSYCVKNKSLDSYIDGQEVAWIYNIFQRIERNITKQEKANDRNTNQSDHIS